ncbi:50S ribosomal protein L2 [Opitutia bacterium KCR 482]|nr:50S ribosomal protein L2 [Opitutae bacterium KCR 482]MDY5583346.1 50S ribosomal protein L2 [Candidatus Merdousia sp.]
MAIIKRRPLTPAQRFLELGRNEVDNKRPERSLTESNHRSRGRNCYGRITSRRRGGGHKKLYRIVDFKRDIVDVPATVMAIEYDPYRTAYIALVQYQNEEKTKRYIIAPDGLKKGDTVMTLSKRPDEFPVGACMPLKFIPPAQKIFCVEMQPGKGAQIARGAGAGAQLVAVEGDMATVKMPSGEIRLINAECRAVIGVVGNLEHQNQSLGKAGRVRWMGKRPRVRGVVMNPVDHPMGGGEGRTSGGGHPVSPWGQLAKGYPTRTKSKPSNSMIVLRRNGKKTKK